MKKVIFFSLIVIAGTLFAGRLLTQSPEPLDDFSSSSHPRASIRIGQEEFSALVADTSERKEKGLSGFGGLGKQEAMIFPYDEPDMLPFWMKDMLFSIDILWLDGDFRVVHFVKGVSPDSYPTTFSPQVPSQYVIEFSEGTLARLDVREGDSVSVSLAQGSPL